MQTRTYEKDGVKRYITEVIADEVEFLNRIGPQDKEQGFSVSDDNPFRIEPTEDMVPF